MQVISFTFFLGKNILEGVVCPNIRRYVMFIRLSFYNLSVGSGFKYNQLDVSVTNYPSNVSPLMAFVAIGDYLLKSVTSFGVLK